MLEPLIIAHANDACLACTCWRRRWFGARGTTSGGSRIFLHKEAANAEHTTPRPKQAAVTLSARDCSEGFSVTLFVEELGDGVVDGLNSTLEVMVVEAFPTSVVRIVEFAKVTVNPV